MRREFFNPKKISRIVAVPSEGAPAIKVTLSDAVSCLIPGVWGKETDEANHGVPVIKTNNMTYEGNIDFSDLTNRVLEPAVFKKAKLNPGDLLVEKSGGTKTHSVGYVNYFDGQSNAYVANNFILVLRPNSTFVRPRFLFYQLKFLYENGNFSNCFNKTTGIQNLQIKTYLGKSINVASFERQDQIVQSLDSIVNLIETKKHETAFLDNLIKSRFIGLEAKA